MLNTKKKWRIGLAQLLVEGGEPERNLERAGMLIQEAAENKCDLVLLPETMDFGWTHPSCMKEAEPIPGKYSNLLVEEARKNKIYICAGLTEKLNDNIYNAAILLNRSGELLLKYHKINLLTIEQPFYQVGTTLNVVATELGALGVNICADNYLDGLSIGEVLARMGAQIILSPSSWTVDYFISEDSDPYKEKWIRPYSSLAGSFNIVVAGTTSVGYIIGGPYEGKKSVGCSLIVNKDGIVAKGSFNEFSSELIIADIEVPERKEKGTAIGEMLQRKKQG